MTYKKFIINEFGLSKTKGVDGFPYVQISELNRIVLAWVLFVKVTNGYALLMGHDIKVLLILNFFSFNQGLSIQCLESLPYVQKLL